MILTIISLHDGTLWDFVCSSDVLPFLLTQYDWCSLTDECKEKKDLGYFIFHSLQFFFLVPFLFDPLSVVVLFFRL